MTHSIETQVKELYDWIENTSKGNLCAGCGKCCDFEAYGHRLYVTSAEMIYLRAKIGDEDIKQMTGPRCPYQVEGRCSIHGERFAACRIFFCKGSDEKQSEISEEAIRILKAICVENGVEYHYMELKKALSCKL